MSEPTVIELRGLHKSFGETRVLKGIDLTVLNDTSAVVMGGSGSGKSVLIKHIVGLLRPDRGEVFVNGRRVDHLKGDDLDQVRLSIGYLFQSGALFDSMCVEDNLDFFLERHSDAPGAERSERICETLSWVGLLEKRYSYPSELSGGQQKRIALARAIILEPEIMLYDEPTTGLDPVSVRSISDLIVKLSREKGVTSVAITHDLLCAEIIADRVHFLHEGQFLTSGDLDDVRHFDHPAISTFFGDAS